MHLVDDNGRELDAEYAAEPDGAHIALIMESRSGQSGSRPPRNPDYNPALTLLLTRLAGLDAVLADALVDSRLTRELGLPEAERRVIEGPVRLAHVPDIEGFRRRMGTAQSRTAQAPGAAKGGNATKRLRLQVDVPGYGPGDAALLARNLATPAAGSASTFIVIWHPVAYREFADEGAYETAIEATYRGEIFPHSWAVGRRTGGIEPGDRAMLWRAHSERGLVASGTVTSEVWTGPHWNRPNELATYVDIDWDTVVDVPDRLPLEDLREAIPDVKWDRLQGGGIEISPTAAARLSQIWAHHTGSLIFRSPDEPRGLNGKGFPEGALKRVEVNRYERDPRARRACLRHWGYRCAVCELSFEERYGPLGRDYIHVHHTLELSRVPPGYHVNPVTDLVPVCPNCHSMIHRSPGPALTVDELRQRLLHG